MPMLPTYLAKDDTYVLPSFLPVPDVPAPGFGKLMVNSYLIKAKEPILIDAGMPIVKEDFLKALWSLVDPEDLKWIFLSHDDGDHTGAMMEITQAAPQARLVTQFVGLARLEAAYQIPIGRVDIRNPGDTFTDGDRECTIRRPPLFDSPATSAYFDTKTKVLFCAASFGAIIPDVAELATDVPDSAFYEDFSILNRLNHPWFALVDQSKFEATVESIRRLEPDIIAGCHAPLAKGPRVEAHLQAMANLPAQGPLDLPDQAALDGILAAIQGGGDGH